MALLSMAGCTSKQARDTLLDKTLTDPGTAEQARTVSQDIDDLASARTDALNKLVEMQSHELADAIKSPPLAEPAAGELFTKISGEVDYVIGKLNDQTRELNELQGPKGKIAALEKKISDDQKALIVQAKQIDSLKANDKREALMRWAMAMLFVVSGLALGLYLASLFYAPIKLIGNVALVVCVTTGVGASALLVMLTCVEWAEAHPVFIVIGVVLALAGVGYLVWNRLKKALNTAPPGSVIVPLVRSTITAT